MTARLPEGSSFSGRSGLIRAQPGPGVDVSGPVGVSVLAAALRADHSVLLRPGAPRATGVAVDARACGIHQDHAPPSFILCVPASDPRQEHLRDLHHVPQFDRLEIEHFFLIYKALEPGKSVEGASWADRTAAEAEVEASRRRLRETQEPEPGRRGR